MKRPALLCAILMLGVIPAPAQLNAPYTRKAESAFYETTTKDSGWVRRTVNTRFDFTSVCLDGKRDYQDVLLVQTVDRTFRSSEEGSHSQIALKALWSVKRRYDTVLWSSVCPADAGEPWGDYYRATKFGCCGAENVTTLLQLRSGSRVVSYTGEPAFVEIPNSQVKRIISYLSANAAEGFGGSPPNAVGVLTLSSDEKVIDRIVLTSDSTDMAWTPKLGLLSVREPSGTAVRLDLWDSEKNPTAEGVTGFAVRINFWDESDATIPVRHDRFDIDSASTKAPVRFERAGGGSLTR
jgi:hypothetical protein